MSDERKPTNRRAKRRREEWHLFLVVAIFLVVVGGAVIAFAYGLEAVALGQVCLLAGVGILILLWAVLLLLERISK